MPDHIDRAEGIAASCRIGALAALGIDGPLVCSVFYAKLSGWDLAFKSRRASQHMRAFARNPKAAMVIFDPISTYADKRGVQLKGTVRSAESITEMEEIVERYCALFDGARKKLPDADVLLQATTESTFFVFRTESYRLIHETLSENETMAEFVALGERTGQE